MAIQNEMPYGRTGWHGDQSVSLRSTLGAAVTLANDIRTQYTGLLAELDTQEGTSLVGDPTYDIAAPAITIPATLQHVALGGAYTHGDNAVALRAGLEGIEVVANELKSNFNALLALLDTSPGSISDGDYVATVSINTANAGSVSPHFANGGAAAHGDQGVQLRLALEGMVAIGNSIKTQHNLLVAKIESDSSAPANTYDPTYDVTATDIS